MPEIARGYTVADVAKLLRISPDKVRTLIKTGRLGAVNTSTCRSRKPRYVVLPHHLEEFERRHAAAPQHKQPRRRKRTTLIDFFPGD
jgi:excisionase family DNA binding protein